MLAGGTAPALTASELAPIVTEAIHRLSASGLDASQIAALQAATFVIQSNLSVTTGALGLTALGSEVVTLDATGAGHGWFIDATPADDSEFGRLVTASELAATDPTAATRYDLLTVVMHELEHVIGVSDVLMPHDLMTDTLAVCAPVAGRRGSLFTTTTGTADATALATALAGPAPTLFSTWRGRATVAAFAGGPGRDAGAGRWPADGPGHAGAPAEPASWARAARPAR